MIDKEFLDEVEYLLARSESVLKEIRKLKQESCVESSTLHLIKQNSSAFLQTNLMVRAIFYSLLLDRTFSKELLTLVKKLGDKEVADFIEKMMKEVR